MHGVRRSAKNGGLAMFLRGRVNFIYRLLHGVQASFDLDRLSAQTDVQKHIIVVALSDPAMSPEAAPFSHAFDSSSAALPLRGQLESSTPNQRTTANALDWGFGGSGWFDFVWSGHRDCSRGRG
jgi:hypothetical protein